MPPVIRVEGLRKSFGDVRAVDGVDLQVERGEILVLLGQNGAGKSTTLRCLGGILRPDSGVIDLDGLLLPDRLDQVRARLGVVPDQARLYGRNTAPEYLTTSAISTAFPKRCAGRGSRSSWSASSSRTAPTRRWPLSHVVWPRRWR